MAMSPEDALDEALDAVMAGDRAAASRAPLAALAGALEAAVPIRPSPETRARHQRLLMQEAAALAPGPAAPQVGTVPRRRRVRRRLAAVAAILAALIVIGAPATAALAANAQPGQALYGIKLATENVELAVQRNPQKKVQLRLKFAEERITEMTALAAHGQAARIPGVAGRLTGEQGQVDAAIRSLQTGGKAPVPLLRTLVRTLAGHARKLKALAQSAGCTARPGTPACRQLVRARAIALRIARRLARVPGVGPVGLVS